MRTTIKSNVEADRHAPSVIAQANEQGRRFDSANVDHAALLDVVTAFNEKTLEAVGRTLTFRLNQSLQTDVLLAAFDPYSSRFTLLGDSRRVETAGCLPDGHPLEQVLSEALLINSTQNQRGNSKTPTPSKAEIFLTETPVRRQLANSLGVQHVLVQLIVDREQRVQGAIVLIGDFDTSQRTQICRQLEELLVPLANVFRLHREASYSVWQRFLQNVKAWLTSKRTPLLAAVALVVIAMMFVPAPYRVKATCLCEPANSRLVVAPFDGQLLTSLVKPGDQVRAGDQVAVMDGSEIRAELAAKQALLQQAQQRHSAALVSGDASTATSEFLEVEQLKQQQAVLQQREARLVLRSPIDGIVVSGDLEQAEGATISIGHRLYEIAPLDNLVAEIAVDETDIQKIRTGQTVSLSFNADFGHRYQAKIERIHPRSELQDNKNIFIAEATIQGDKTGLAPGLRGHARIDSGRQSIGWIIFHQPYNAWCRYWGWY